MKIECYGPDFASAMAAAMGAIERHNTAPILGHVLISTSGAIGTVTATNLDMEVSADFAVVSDTDESATVLATPLHAALRKMGDKNVTLKIADGKAVVSAGRSRVTLPSLDATDFPRMENSDNGSSFAIPAHDLDRLIRKSIDCVSTEETRYYLNGIYLHLVDGKLRAVATDGHRLARIDCDVQADFEPVIIPGKATSQIAKLINGIDGDVQATISDRMVRFSVPGTAVTSKVIDGTFPDYGRVIPDNLEMEAKANTSEFRKAIDMATLVSSDKSRAVKLVFADNTATAYATSGDGSEAVAEFDYENDASGEVGMNSKYLAGVLALIEGEATFKFDANGRSPCIILDADDPNALYVVMPMRV